MTTAPILFSKITAIISGLGIGILGLMILRMRDSRPRGWLAFGLFAVVWSIQILTINIPQAVESSASAELLYLISAAALLPLAYFLLEFTAAHARPGRSTLTWRFLRTATAGIAILGAALVALRPELLLQGVSPDAIAGGFYPNWGPYYAFVTFVTKLAFAIALIGLYTSVSGAPTSRTGAFSAVMAAGLGIYVGFNAANNLPFFLRDPSGLQSLGYIAVFGISAVVCLLLGVFSLRQARKTPTSRERRFHLLLSGAYLLPLIWGGIEGVISATIVTGLLTLGVWRLAAVGVIAYGFSRWRNPDLSGRVRRAGATATGGASALAVGGTGFGVATVLSGGLALPLLAGAAATGATAMPALSWARRLFGVSDEDNPVDEAEQLYEQKIETYRAALEDAMARDTLEEDEAFLAGLRERFGISDEEDRILRYYARKATVPRREGDPDTSYERLRILGEGGAGRTWLARDRSRDRLVVLKEPLEKWHNEPAVLQAARREAELAAKVRHPHVVEVEEVLEDDGRPVLVMEYVTGGSLADKLRREGTLSAREAVKVGFDLARGLQAIHEAGIVHRDLTPDNVLIAEEGRAMIADFGLARTQDGSSTQLLEDEAGTRGYQAPEAARGSDESAVDVYGLAAILHTCLYGSPPVEGTVQVEADVPRELQAAIENGLSRDPDDRYGDARAFAEALEEVVHA